MQDKPRAASLVAERSHDSRCSPLPTPIQKRDDVGAGRRRRCFWRKATTSSSARSNSAKPASTGRGAPVPPGFEDRQRPAPGTERDDSGADRAVVNAGVRDKAGTLQGPGAAPGETSARIASARKRTVWLRGTGA